jgi:hypothetical protein
VLAKLAAEAKQEQEQNDKAAAKAAGSSK